MAEHASISGDDANLIPVTLAMKHPLQARWKRWQHGVVQSLLLYHGREDHATVRVLLLACIGTVGMPLYYVIWQHFFPQEYESLSLRMLGHIKSQVDLYQSLSLYLRQGAT